MINNETFVPKKTALPDNKNHLKKNIMAVTSGAGFMTTQTKEKVQPAVAPNRGKVPKYLDQRKETLKKEALARVKKIEVKSYPPGTRLLDETERVTTLDNLTKKRNEIVKGLDSLPISMDTLRARTRKRKLDAELDELDAAIKVYQRTKVFVAI